MISEENERLAEMAYKRFRADHDKTLPEWEAFGPKHKWRDLVQTFESIPRSHIAIANPMEACVSAVLTEKAEGGIPVRAAVQHPEPVIEPEKIKPAKAFRK